MLSSFLILLREAIEAALVIGLVLGFLAKTNQKAAAKYVWFGLGAGLVGSLISAGLFVWLVGEFEGPAEQIFEGITMAAGAILLFTLVIWLVDQKSKSVTSGLQGKESGLLDLEVFLVVFFSVLREGVETVLFIGASSFSDPINNLWGGLAGLAAAVLLAWLFFNGTLKLKLGSFFLFTNVLLILFGAGLLAHGIGEFIEAGVLPPLVEHLWNIAPVMADGSLPFWHEDEPVGSVFKSLFGYASSPALLQVIGYLAFVAGSLLVLFSRQKPAPKA